MSEFLDRIRAAENDIKNANKHLKRQIGTRRRNYCSPTHYGCYCYNSRAC